MTYTSHRIQEGYKNALGIIGRFMGKMVVGDSIVDEKELFDDLRLLGRYMHTRKICITAAKILCINKQLILKIAGSVLSYIAIICELNQ